MKRILVVLIVVALSACATTGSVSVRYPNSITPEIQARFDSAENLYKAKRLSEADASFEKLIREMPYTELTDEARFRRGEIAFLGKNYTGALEFYRESYSQIASPRVAPKAHFKAAMSLFKMKRGTEAVDELDKINRREASTVLKLRVDSLGAKACAAKGAPNSCIVWNLRLVDDYPAVDGTTISGLSTDELVSEMAALTEVKRWVADKTVTEAEVDALPMKEMKGKLSGGYAAYKQALVVHTNGDTRKAAGLLKSYVSTYPRHEMYSSARLLLGETGGTVGDAGGIAIGVLLPLSGKFANYGESTLHGIECAAGVFEPCTGPTGIKLVIKDTESAIGGAVGAVGELAGENVVAIIGPLLSSHAVEAAKKAEELGIPLISLSQREGVAEVGDYVFRNSVSDYSEMKTLADYATGTLKLKRFFILYPEGKKSVEYKTLFTQAVKDLGGSVVASRSYTQNELAGASMSELRNRGATENAEPTDETKPGFVLSTGVTGYDALFVPDSLPVANFIAQRTALNGVARFKLLGISRWDNQKDVEKGGGYTEGAVFVDSFYKEAADENVSLFVSRFNGTYGVEPTLLEALSYDAMRMVISAVMDSGAKKRESVKDALARISGFSGVTGKITFNPQGDAERQLWVLTIRGGKIRSAN